MNDKDILMAITAHSTLQVAGLEGHAIEQATMKRLHQIVGMIELSHHIRPSLTTALQNERDRLARCRVEQIRAKCK